MREVQKHASDSRREFLAYQPLNVLIDELADERSHVLILWVHGGNNHEALLIIGLGTRVSIRHRALATHSYVVVRPLGNSGWRRDLVVVLWAAVLLLTPVLLLIVVISRPRRSLHLLVRSVEGLQHLKDELEQLRLREDSFGIHALPNEL